LRLWECHRNAVDTGDLVVFHRSVCTDRPPGGTAALDRRISDGQEDALRQLRTLNRKAVETLRQLLDDEETPAGVKMTTAFKILEIATPAYVADTDRSETIGEDSLKRIREQIYGIFPADHDNDESANRTERVHHSE
jgi:hypothetical protein